MSQLGWLDPVARRPRYTLPGWTIVPLTRLTPFRNGLSSHVTFSWLPSASVLPTWTVLTALLDLSSHTTVTMYGPSTSISKLVGEVLVASCHAPASSRYAISAGALSVVTVTTGGR